MQLLEEKTNEIILEGKIATDVTISHTKNKKTFFSFYLEQREENTFKKNMLPIIIEKNIENFSILEKGKFVKIVGNLRSYDFIEENKLHLILRVYVKKIDVLEPNKYSNSITLVGNLCKNAFIINRKQIKIVNLLLAVNRNYLLKNKSDYIPCVLTFKNSENKVKIDDLKVKTKVKITGFFQSRIYLKKDFSKKIALEVAIDKIEILKP